MVIIFALRSLASFAGWLGFGHFARTVVVGAPAARQNRWTTGAGSAVAHLRRRRRYNMTNYTAGAIHAYR
jgi:hypothetical protein